MLVGGWTKRQLTRTVAQGIACNSVPRKRANVDGRWRSLRDVARELCETSEANLDPLIA